MNKGIRGFTIIELAITMVIFSVIVFSIMYWFFQIQKNQNKIESTEELSADVKLSESILNRMIVNSVKLHPLEDLYASGDGLYQGINGLNRQVNNCRYQRNGLTEETFSVLRFTTVDFEQPERLYRAWNDQNTAVTSNENLARLTYHNSPKYIFQIGNIPQEVTVIDAESRYTQRYRVNSSSTITTSLDPQYDEPQSTNYTYTRADFKMPRGLTTVFNSRKSMQFITGSAVYATKTYHLCVSNEDNLVLIDTSDDSERILINSLTNKFRITKFEVKFSAIRDTTTLNDASFTLFPSDPILSQCVNAVNLNLEFTPRNSPVDPPIVSTSKKTVFLNNFNSKRPLACF